MTTTELRTKLEAMDRREIIRLLARMEYDYGGWHDDTWKDRFQEQFDGIIGYCQMSTADLREHVFDWAGGNDHEDEDPNSEWEVNINKELAELAKMEPEAYQYLVNEEPRPKLPQGIAEQIALTIEDKLPEQWDHFKLIMEAFALHVQLT